jgi:hypothetical protein
MSSFELHTCRWLYMTVVQYRFSTLADQTTIWPQLHPKSPPSALSLPLAWLWCGGHQICCQANFTVLVNFAVCLKMVIVILLLSGILPTLMPCTCFFYQAFTPKGDQLFHSPTFRYYSSSIEQSRYLGVNVEENIRWVEHFKQDWFFFRKIQEMHFPLKVLESKN